MRMLSASVSLSCTLALVLGGVAAGCTVNTTGSDDDDGGAGGPGAQGASGPGVGGSGGAGASGGNAGSGGSGGSGAGSSFSTFDCTNSVPLACPANDCYEQAAGADNDDPGRATQLGPDGPIDAILCRDNGPSEFDYYTILAPPGCAIAVDASFDYGTGAEQGDISMYFERNGTSVLQDTNSDLDGQIGIQTVSRSTEPYQVYFVNTAQSEPAYSLEHTADCAPLSCPGNDRNEPNDAPNDASGGSGQLTLLGDTFGAIACPGEEDWYYHPATTTGVSCTPMAIIRFDAAFDGVLSADLRVSDVTDIDEQIDTSTPGQITISALSNVAAGALVSIASTTSDAPTYTVELLCK